MKKVLVTGSTGFVGHHLINLLKNSYSVIGLTHSSTPPSEDNVTYLPGDITQKDEITSILKKHLPDKIVHLAAQAKVATTDTQQLFNTNLLGTLNLYQSVLNVKESNKEYHPTILYISSSEVYGHTDNPEDILETSTLNPLSFYASSKVAADRLSYQMSQSHKLKIIIARPFVHIGPLQQAGFFVPDMISQILELERNDSKETLFVGNLESIREYFDVRDVVKAYKLLLEKEIPPGEVFNICRGEGIKTREVLEKLLTFSKKKIKIEIDPSRLRPLDTPILIGNNSKIKKITGWIPEISLEQSLQDTFDYWRSLSIKS